MSYPRELLKNSTYLVTRKCTQDLFLLAPAPWVNQIFLYCIAVAAERFDIDVHAVCVLSNHWHAVLTDRRAQLPRFMEWVHKYVAKCMNAHLDRTQNFWSNEKYSAVRLETPDDALDKIVYVLANPVAALAVSRADLWPGLHTAGVAFGTRLKVSRPDVFFRRDGDMPETATLVLKKLPWPASLSNRAFTARVEERLAGREADLQADARARGYRIQGARACRKLKRTQRPSRKTRQCGISPTIAARDLAIRQAALERRQAFLTAYQDARERWKRGDRDVIFPPGTYWLRVHGRVRCRRGGVA